MVAELRLHLFLRDECLDDTGEREAKHERPERLPEHEEAFTKAPPGVHENRDEREPVHYERTIRAMAAVASLILSSASWPPVGGLPRAGQAVAGNHDQRASRGVGEVVVSGNDNAHQGDRRVGRG